MKKQKQKTNLFIISGPSGVGEDSIIKGLEKRGWEIERVITTVTRKKRHGEKDGKPYYFISRERFKQLIKKKKFIEWNLVYGDYRGATFQEIKRVKEKIQEMKSIGVWKVDYKGVRAIKKKFPEIVAILIKPESIEILEKRLMKRDKDTEIFKKRKEYTQDWLKHENYYDYVVVNEQGKLKQAIDEVERIIKKHI